MANSVHLHYCQTKEDHFPMAITRFTSYDIDKKPLSVEQVTYESSIEYLERQVINALSCDVEVSILTTLPINKFKKLHRIFQASK